MTLVLGQALGAAGVGALALSASYTGAFLVAGAVSAAAAALALGRRARQAAVA
ncbi:hypothetical protein [Cellulosimicrobium cellulans]|uniref:hypothetical protein n=1 Tax=Cellulosimicrobium cellulans TaxID=1710 RepID=UPI001495FAA8|nr:hypothetical protein [Cellulosimicrobium cellulans]